MDLAESGRMMGEIADYLTGTMFDVTCHFCGEYLEYCQCDDYTYSPSEETSEDKLRADEIIEMYHPEA